MSRVLARFIQGDQSNDNAVATAIMVRYCAGLFYALILTFHLCRRLMWSSAWNQAFGTHSMCVRSSPIAKQRQLDLELFFGEVRIQLLILEGILTIHISGYFQSVRPAIGHMLINVDISTGMMYKDGPLINLCLEFLGQPGNNPNLLSMAAGFPPARRHNLQRFVTGVRGIVPATASQTRTELI